MKLYRTAMTRLYVWNDFLSARDDLESRSSNLDPSEGRAQSSELECPCTHDPETQGGKQEGGTTAYGSNYGCGAVNIGDQYLYTSCRRRKFQNQSLEILLEVILLLVSVHAAGAYALGQMIRIREHDPTLKRSLEASIALFAASFFCTFLGALILLIIVSRRECRQYKKLCLVISNTAAFILMMIGYCFVVAFNI